MGGSAIGSPNPAGSRTRALNSLADGVALVRGSWVWLWLELIVNGMVVLAGLGVADLSVVRCHIIAMLIGQCLTSFFAVWTVHRDCDRYHYIARTIRSRVGSFFTFNMFYHVEHHLFPKVPTCNLPELAARLRSLRAGAASDACLRCDVATKKGAPRSAPCLAERAKRFLKALTYN